MVFSKLKDSFKKSQRQSLADLVGARLVSYEPLFIFRMCPHFLANVFLPVPGNIVIITITFCSLLVFLVLQQFSARSRNVGLSYNLKYWLLKREKMSYCYNFFPLWLDLTIV